VTGGATGRQRVFAVTQIAASFILLAGASVLLKTLLALQATQTGIDIRRVLAVNVPVISYQRSQEQVLDFYKEMVRRIREMPGVDGVAIGTAVPWRDAQSLGFGLALTGEGRPSNPTDDPRARLRVISPGFFAALGVPIVAGRDFNDADRPNNESVVIISQTLANRLFPGQDPINRHLMWTDPVLKFIGMSSAPHRIIGVTADLDDEHIVPGPMLTVYHAFGQQELWGGRLFVHVRSNPYALVSPITRIIREMSVEQPVERAATLEDVRAEVLTPERLNTVVFGGFAVVALAIALVGVAGVLAFSVSGRTREFGIRMAIGSPPRLILMRVLSEGAVMAALGIGAGVIGGIALLKVAGSYLHEVRSPGALPVAVSAIVLLIAAAVASVVPAARAARIDVTNALRAD
jgi:predicted permease